MTIAGAATNADFRKICPLLSRRTTTHDYGASETHRVHVKYVTFGDERPVIVAGPCSVESYEQTLELAHAVKSCGGDMLRGGAFKPRTSPHDFQGLGIEGLQILHEVGRQTGLPVVTEVMDPRLVEQVGEYADMLQIGSRNMQNYPLLVEVGRYGKPVLLSAVWRRACASGSEQPNTLRRKVISASYSASAGSRPTPPANILDLFWI